MTLSDELSALSLGPTKFYEWAIARSDPRVADWFLMQSPLPTIALIIIYLTIVNIGPRLMKNRKPFDLKPILVVYNLFLVGLSAYIVFELVDASYRAGYNYICQPMSYSNNKNHIRIAAALWWYWFSKFIEFFDTFFFILRKKSNQVTFLHVYHHASMAYLWWIGIKWVAGGQSMMAALVNSMVHVIMYFYYALAAMGLHRFLWWKKHITHLQLIQFFGAGTQAVWSLYIDCPFPKWMHLTLIAYACSLIVLFLNFYIHAYCKRKHSGKGSSATSNGTPVSNGTADKAPLNGKKKTE